MNSESRSSGKESADYSGKSILISNGFAILLALFQGWPLYPLMVVYWCQSVIIGGFNVARMLRLKQFSTEGFTANNRPVPENEKGKRSTAFFFFIHYGLFHVVYLVFLGSGLGYFLDAIGGSNDALKWEAFWLLAAVLGFFGSHWFSYRKNVEADLARRPNIGTMMFLPYLRIIPMHLTMIIGGALSPGGVVLVLFMVLKTLADYLMHIAEHRIMRKTKKVSA